MTSRIILWDVMDTLVRDPFRDAMPGFFGMTLEQMLAVKHPSAWAAFERGELTEEAFLQSFFRDGRSFDSDGFKACIRDAYAWVDGMQPLLAALHARGHDMHVLSNYPEWHQWIEQRLELSHYLTWTFVSCRTGLRKPDLAVYERAARELGVATEQCLFIDDRAVNCDAARSVGMAAIEFNGNADELREQLTAQAWL